MVRIAGFHPADPGSSPGMGNEDSYLASPNTRYSSVGRAEDCSSLGHWFESGCRDMVSWCNLVSIQDFESCDLGSNPGETFFL